MCLQYTPTQFYETFLKGNEMTAFVEKYIDYDDMDFVPSNEDDYYEDIYSWYKVKDIDMNDRIEEALLRAETLPFFTMKGCLFIGFTWYGTSYEHAQPFLDFLKEMTI